MYGRFWVITEDCPLLRASVRPGAETTGLDDDTCLACAASYILRITAVRLQIEQNQLVAEIV